MLLAVDGPEKAGKTTFIQHVIDEWTRPHGWHVVHVRCRRPKPFAADAYLDMLKLATRADTLVILDRTWASEVVYTRLLDRETAGYAPLTAEEAEWQLGRAVPQLGAAVMLFDAPARLAARRDGTDLAVDPLEEHAAFVEYGRTHGWMLEDAGQWADVEGRRQRLAARVMLRVIARSHDLWTAPDPHVLAGSGRGGVVVMGQEHGPWKSAPKLSWLPLCGYGTRWLQEVVPPPYHDFLWTNADAYRQDQRVREAVHDCAVAVALGKVAARDLRELGFPGEVVEAPHPAAARRWGNLRTAWPAERWATLFRAARNRATELGTE